MSLINKEISDFSAQAYQNGEFRTVTKQDALGKWSLFFFYPADFTFVCPTELEDLQNKYAEFKAAGCEVYSVSTDTHFVHKAWHDHSERISKITYPMLADPTHALSRDFEVYIEENGLALKAVRKSLVDLGYVHNNPIMSVGTLGLPVSPALKLTDRGLVDVKKGEIVPLIVSEKRNK